VIFCPAGLEPEKITATTVYGARVFGVRGSYDDCSRLVSELAGEVEWGFVNVNLRSYYAEGSKTLAFEIVEQLGWEAPTAVVCPIASGALFSKLWQGFEQFRRLGLFEGPPPRLYGGQAEGCSPVAAAFAEDRRVTPVRPNSTVRSLAIGNPADGDLAIATARASGGAIYAVPGTRSDRTSSSSPSRPAFSARRLRGSRWAPCAPRWSGATSASPTVSSCSSPARG
jgi:threonine synthase